MSSPLDQFAQFTAFPLELRLQIWRSTWKGQEVCINWKPRFKDKLEQAQAIRHERKSPITLAINKESRKETLQRFKILPRDQTERAEHDDDPQWPSRAPVYFHPLIDLPYITTGMVAEEESSWSAWISVTGVLPGATLFYQFITTLRIRDFFGDHSGRYSLRFSCFPLWARRCLPKLKRVEIMLAKGSVTMDGINGEANGDWENPSTDMIMALYKAEFWMVGEVTLVDWVPLE